MPESESMKQAISVGGPAIAGMFAMGVFALLLIRWCLKSLNDRAEQDGKREAATVGALNENTEAIKKLAVEVAELRGRLT